MMFPGTVPDKTLEVPEQLLDLKFGNTKIYINGTYDADQVKRIIWKPLEQTEYKYEFYPLM